MANLTTHYTALHADSDNDLPGDLDLQATTDAEAVAEVNKLVAEGFRNSAWASIELSDGRGYIASNQDGKAVGQYTPRA